jgi:hypothetical protein
MRFGKAILVAVVALALTAFVLDCAAATTPAEAMQCCSSMPCSSHSHASQDCCKSMPTVHAAFVQPSGAPTVSMPALQPLALGATAHAIHLHSFGMRILGNEHAPPEINVPDLNPLRI